MKRIIMGMALFAPGAAFGADASVFSASPAARWAGLYVGATLGEAWSSTSGFSVDQSSAPFEERSSSGGLSAGLKVGFNVQNERVVVGLEADIQSANLNASTNYVDRSAAPSASEKLMASVNWFSTFRSRFGFLATPSMLLYATVGFAMAEVEMTDTWVIYNPALIGAGILPSAKSRSATNIGWVVGGGVEYAFAPQWSVVMEAMYADFGTASYQDIDAFGRVMRAQSGEVALGIARAGINYRF